MPSPFLGKSVSTTLIVGSDGQDGRLMTELLAAKGLQCVGLNRTSCDIRDYNSVFAAIKKSKPNYLFYFAAHHTSATDELSIARNREYFDTNTIGLLNCLDAIKNVSVETRLFFTSSSLIFKPHPTERLHERSPLALDDLYTISKHASMKLCDYYREKFGLHTTVGIMFNHESHYRQSKFVSKKIVEYVVSVKQGKLGKLSLGDLGTTVDWGAAEDYMEAAHQLLLNNKTGDYVISSGVGHTLRNFCEVAFSYVGLDYSNYISTDCANVLRVNHTRIGDNSKIRSSIGWAPKISFEELIKNMVDYQIREGLCK